MLYLIALVCGIVIALVKGGNIKTVLNFLQDIKYFWVAVFAAMFQIVLFMLINKFIWLSDYLLYIQIISYGLLFFFWIANSKYMGCLIYGIGTLANVLPIIFNDGKMPVDITKVGYVGMQMDFKHSIITDSTNLEFLCDVFSLPGILSWGMQVISIGDIIIAVGMFYITLNALTMNKYNILYNKFFKIYNKNNTLNY